MLVNYNHLSHEKNLIITPRKDMNYLVDEVFSSKDITSKSRMRRHNIEHKEIDLVLITDHSGDLSIDDEYTQLETYNKNSTDLSSETLNIVKSFLKKVDQDLSFGAEFDDNSDLSFSYESVSTASTSTEDNNSSTILSEPEAILVDESFLTCSSCDLIVVDLKNIPENRSLNKCRLTKKLKQAIPIIKPCRKHCYMCALDGYPRCPLFN